MAQSPRDLSSLPDHILDNLAKALDKYDKPNWRSIVSVLPKGMYTPQNVELFGMAMLKPRGSPTKALLKDLGRRNKTVSDLISYLRKVSEKGFTVSSIISLIEQSDNIARQSAFAAQPIRITRQPEYVIGFYGQEVEVSCQATGQEPLSFQWFHNRNPINIKSGVFRIASLDKFNVGYYICRISNTHDVAFTNWVRVDVLPEPSEISESAPLITSHPRSVSCNKGESFQLVCKAVGSPDPSFQWYLDDQKIAKATEKYYRAECAQPNHSGLYTCVATNCYGTARSIAAHVDVISDTKLQPIPNAYNVRGGRPSINSVDCEHFCSRFPVSKVALLVGNQKYQYENELGKLVHPGNDARDIAGALSSIGFTVVSLCDLTLQEFHRAVSFFCELISEDVYALFYFAGHGFEVQGNSYLMPVDASPSFSTKENYPASEILGNMLKRKSKLNILMLDCCRTTPNSYLENPLPKMCQGLHVTQSNVVLCFGCCSDSRVLESPLHSNGFFAESFCAHVYKNTMIDVLMYEISSTMHRQRIIDPATGRLQVIYRHSTLVDPISLCDPVLPADKLESGIHRQLEFWRKLHQAPPSPITVFCNEYAKVDFVFTAEFSNVLLIQSRIYANNDCSVRFLLPSSIGGARVDILHDEKKINGAGPRAEVVRISNLELLEGEITIHIEVTYWQNNQPMKKMTFYTLNEKPLYAKINEFSDHSFTDV